MHINFISPITKIFKSWMVLISIFYSINVINAQPDTLVHDGTTNEITFDTTVAFYHDMIIPDTPSFSYI